MQSTGAVWNTGRQTINGVFSMQALPRWETAEGNPIFKIF